MQASIFGHLEPRRQALEASVDLHLGGQLEALHHRHEVVQLEEGHDVASPARCPRPGKQRPALRVARDEGKHVRSRTSGTDQASKEVSESARERRLGGGVIRVSSKRELPHHLARGTWAAHTHRTRTQSSMQAASLHLVRGVEAAAASQDFRPPARFLPPDLAGVAS